MLKAMIASETDAEKLAALGHERLGCTRAEEAKKPEGNEIISGYPRAIRPRLTRARSGRRCLQLAGAVQT